MNGSFKIYLAVVFIFFAAVSGVYIKVLESKNAKLMIRVDELKDELNEAVRVNEELDEKFIELSKSYDNRLDALTQLTKRSEAGLKQINRVKDEIRTQKDDESINDGLSSSVSFVAERLWGKDGNKAKSAEAGDPK